MGSGGVDDARFIAEVAVRLHELERKELDRERKVEEAVALVFHLDKAVKKIGEVASSLSIAPDYGFQVHQLQDDVRQLSQNLEIAKVEIGKLREADRDWGRAKQERADDIADISRRFSIIETGFKNLTRAWDALAVRTLWIAVAGVVGLIWYMAGIR